MAGKTKNRRTGGSGSVFQDSKGRWHFRKDMGTDPATGRRRPPIEATGMVKSEARARFQAKIAEWERDGRLPTKDGPKTADYFERWMEEHRTAVNPTTWRNESSWMRTMNAIIGNIRLNRLTADDINGMCRRLRRTRKSKTVNTYLAVLGAMLRTAKRDGLIADDPMENVGRMPEDRYERPILDVADPAKVIEAALAEPDPAVAVFDSPDEREKWALMFELAFTTGMRPGERYGLMPYQLELHHGIPVINVCQQAKPIPAGATIPDWMEAEHLDGAIWLTKPKTAKGVRTVPIPQGLWDRLWAHIVKWGVPSHGLVFTNLYGHPIRRDNEEKRWRRALKMAGLPYVDIYSARHWLPTHPPPPAAPPFGHNHRGIAGKIRHDQAGLGFFQHGAAWHADDQVIGVLAFLAGTAAIFAIGGGILALIAEVHQGGQVWVRLEHDVAAAAAIAAVRAASRDELFAVEADRAIAALAGVQPDGCDINKITGTGHVLPPLGGVANTKNRE